MAKFKPLTEAKFQTFKDESIAIQNQIEHYKSIDNDKFIDILNHLKLSFASTSQYFQIVKLYQKLSQRSIKDTMQAIDWRANFYYKHLNAVNIYQQAYNQLQIGQYQKAIDVLNQLEAPSDYQFLQIVDLDSLLNELRHTHNKKYKSIFKTLNHIRNHNPHTHVAINLVSLINSNYQRVKIINNADLNQRLESILLVSEFLNQHR